jgi:hypothetical protein
MGYKSNVAKSVFYYKEGKFVKRFRKVYQQYSEYAGKPFKVIKTIKKGCEGQDENGNIVWQPMYCIQFADGNTFTAFAEEVCVLI